MAGVQPVQRTRPPDPCRTEDCENMAKFGMDACHACHTVMMEEVWRVFGFKDMTMPPDPKL
jgi:hypothetical protein